MDTRRHHPGIFALFLNNYPKLKFSDMTLSVDYSTQPPSITIFPVSTLRPEVDPKNPEKALGYAPIMQKMIAEHLGFNGERVLEKTSYRRGEGTRIQFSSGLTTLKMLPFPLRLPGYPYVRRARCQDTEGNPVETHKDEVDDIIIHLIAQGGGEMQPGFFSRTNNIYALIEELIGRTLEVWGKNVFLSQFGV